MKEYISRTEAEEAIEKYCCKMCEYYNEAEGGCVFHALHCPHLSGEEILKPVESADVQPVKRGRWKSSQRTIETGTVYCSNCAIEYYISNLQTVGDCNGIVHYCPNCGAEMRGENNDTL